MGVKNFIAGAGIVFLSYSALYSQDISNKLRTLTKIAEKYVFNGAYNEYGRSSYFDDVSIKKNKAISFDLKISSNGVFKELDADLINFKGMKRLKYNADGSVKEIQDGFKEINVSSITAHEVLDDLIKHYSQKE